MPKMTTSEFRERRHQARSDGITEGSIWRHYKGGIYAVDGFGIDTHHGGFLVRYHRVGGPSFDAQVEEGIQFLRPPEEWLECIDQSSNTWRFMKLSE